MASRWDAEQRRRAADSAADWATTRGVHAGDEFIRYREAGTGPTVVLVHGLGVSADYWTRVGPRLAAAGFHVLAPDLPGFGRSTDSTSAESIDGQAGALDRWATTIGLSAAVYVGHSLACQTVVELAARVPESVRGIILAAPTGRGAPLRRIVRQAIGLVRDVPRESVLLAALVLQAYSRAGPRRILRTWLRAARHDPIPVLERVTVRGIIVIGERDPVVDLEFAHDLARRLLGGTVVLVPGTAHAVHFDRSGLFVDAIARFARAPQQD